MQPTDPLPFLDLRADYLALKPELDAAVARVLDRGWYILGKEVATFEAEFAAFLTGARQVAKNTVRAGQSEIQHPTPNIECVGVNSGTDALQLALWACDVGPGDEVITVSHTAVATAAAIRLTGATPVFVDVDPATYTMDPALLETAITPHTKAIVPVHLYGHPAEMAPILEIARRHGLRVIEDCAQAHGATYRGQPVGTLGDLGCFSFYPTKNLGALGDSGAVVGRTGDLIDRVRRLREYGWTPQARYISQEEGMNSRLDEIQAAILRVKLKYLDQWNRHRRDLAMHYATRLPAAITKPIEQPGCTHVYHLYVVRAPEREHFRQRLQAAGIGTAIHYPAPIHQQPGYTRYATRHPLSHTERLAHEIVSLPMHPHLTEQDVVRVADAVTTALAV
ncbi:MAG: erythromycin biosynthesis sensory transduction protein eryC1 [Chloroflexi bacterium]|nr:MAG: erythromycin biosynthesis sensory transduction protein eryC1 [Chloroflexota bacterium]